MPLVQVHGGEEFYAPWPLLALQIWGCGKWNKLREKNQFDTPHLGGLQGYPVLQRPASSCGRVVAQPSGGRCLVSHLWEVEPDLKRRCLAATSDYAHQLVGIACGRFHAEKSDSSSARGRGARRQAQVRGGSAPTSGYGSQQICTVCRQRQCIQVTTSAKICFC